ncbi:arylamine N-acetyltransferase [bacterium]|nr:arylamine N-acetyltransferase [bacterium]
MTQDGEFQGLDPRRDGCAASEFSRRFAIPASSPELSLLCAILDAFSAFPYENISKIIKNSQVEREYEKIRLPGEILADHFEYGLGGTCFSLTYLLDCILKHRGFNCYPVSADMRYGVGIHCALVAVVDRRHYLVDPGYCITAPLPLDRNAPVYYRTPSSGIRLQFSAGESIDLFTFDRRGEKWRYRFSDIPLPYDRFMRNWLHSFTLNSMHALCLNRMHGGVMTYLHRHTLRRTDGGTVSKTDASVRVHALVQEHFGIAPRFVEEAEAVLAMQGYGRNT